MAASSCERWAFFSSVWRAAACCEAASTSFSVLGDRTAQASFVFARARTVAATKTTSYDVTVTNTGQHDLSGPFYLTLDGLGATGATPSTMNTDPV